MARALAKIVFFGHKGARIYSLASLLCILRTAYPTVAPAALEQLFSEWRKRSAKGQHGFIKAASLKTVSTEALSTVLQLPGLGGDTWLMIGEATATNFLTEMARDIEQQPLPPQQPPPPTPTVTPAEKPQDTQLAPPVLASLPYLVHEGRRIYAIAAAGRLVQARVPGFSRVKMAELSNKWCGRTLKSSQRGAMMVRIDTLAGVAVDELRTTLDEPNLNGEHYLLASEAAALAYVTDLQHEAEQLLRAVAAAPVESTLPVPTIYQRILPAVVPDPLLEPDDPAPVAATPKRPREIDLTSSSPDTLAPPAAKRRKVDDLATILYEDVGLTDDQIYVIVHVFGATSLRQLRTVMKAKEYEDALGLAPRLTIEEYFATQR